MEYLHTQQGRLHHVVYGIATILIVIAWLLPSDSFVKVMLGVTACLMVFLSLCFGSLTVMDEGERLSVRFGPIPLFSTSIAYADMTRVEPGKSTIIDGWGIHYLPGRGWTYNLWGFDCAVVHVGKRIIRIGSDDVDQLVEFLSRRIESLSYQSLT